MVHIISESLQSFHAYHMYIVLSPGF